MANKFTLNYSQNFEITKRSPKSVRFVIFHYTGMKKENDAIKRLKDPKVDYICCIYPTAILIQISDLKKGLKKIISGHFDYVFSASKHEKSVLRSFSFNNSRIKQILPKSYSFRTQDLTDTYYDSAQFYWGARKSWINEMKIFNSNSQIILIPEDRCQDIDDPKDLIAAKEKFNKYREKKLKTFI